MAQRTQNTTLWVWWNSSLHVAKLHSHSKDGTAFHARHMAWQGHNIQWEPHWNFQQGCSSTDNQKASSTRKVQQATDGRDQQITNTSIHNWWTMRLKTITGLQTTEETSKGRDRHTDLRIRHSTTTSTTSTTTNSINRCISTMCHCWLTNGNSTNKLSHQTITAIAKTNSFRWSGRRQSAKATSNNRSINRSSKTWHNTRATKEQTTNHKGDNANKESGRNHSIHLWWHHRTTNREDPFGTNGQQHRRIRQTKDHWRNQEWDRPHEKAAGIHGTKKEHHTIKMGSQGQRQQRSCTNCSKGLHRVSQRPWRHLCLNTHLLRPQNTSHHLPQQRLDSQNRRHLNGFSTCRSSNNRPVHASTKRVLQTRGQHRLETPQSNLWTEEQSKSLAKPPSRSPTTPGTSTQQSRAQHLHDTNKRLLHPRLRRRPSLSRRTTGGGQALHSHSATSSSTSNRYTRTRENSFFPWTQHHQRW